MHLKRPSTVWEAGVSVAGCAASSASLASRTAAAACRGDRGRCQLGKGVPRSRATTPQGRDPRRARARAAAPGGPRPAAAWQRGSLGLVLSHMHIYLPMGNAAQIGIVTS